ncbi:MAG: hypothetical protein WCA22_01370 [Candidatus Binatus sp.]
MRVAFVAPAVAAPLCGALMSGCAQTVESKPAVMQRITSRLLELQGRAPAGQ